MNKPNKLKPLPIKVTIAAIDALLPQTQCGECGYQGCLPYAQAIVNQGETIDRCVPGGVATLQQLGELVEQDIASYLPGMQQKAKPKLLAVIDEAICIGCTLCIQACPVDAILGSAKQMHSVIGIECTGCGLCIPPCPMDCIEMLNAPDQNYYPDHARKRYQSRLARLAQPKIASSAPLVPTQAETLASKKAEIMAAVARARAKRG